MTRTALYKTHYFGIVCLGGCIGIAALLHFRFSASSLLFTLAIALLPGRVLGYFWRDLLRGLRLLQSRQFAESKLHSERFLMTLPQRTWIKRLVWLGSSAYSHDPEVLALNNLGAAEIGLGNAEQAKSRLLRAIEIDERCPLPFFNLGVLYRNHGDQEKAANFFQRAAQLGYDRTWSDKVVMAAQSRFASIDGAGRSTSPSASHGPSRELRP